jgi:hypothetical protein
MVNHLLFSDIYVVFFLSKIYMLYETMNRDFFFPNVILVYAIIKIYDITYFVCNYFLTWNVLYVITFSVI